ncbi:MAG TPA: GNAT family N-acetyltransferase [Nitrososphaeraceae archaeon]|jgi:ribosomal protein S18 acetylase RimI-like enzyme|nr:GNAT family N-acetyltransferase [Nitrososphaeraceae archaeon]
MNKDYDRRFTSETIFNIPESRLEVIIRNINLDDINKILQLQEASFADMAAYGMIWPASFLKKHIGIFPQGQLCAEINGKIVASASSLVVTLKPQYSEHTWHEITGGGLFTTHDPKGDTLYGADISTHPEFQRKGIGSMLYNVRKNLAIKMNLRRIVIGGRLFNYYKYANKMSAIEYSRKAIEREIEDPVLLFQLKNGFKFIKILPNYLNDRRSMNYSNFLEWLNPYHQ